MYVQALRIGARLVGVAILLWQLVAYEMFSVLQAVLLVMVLSFFA